jgi:flagellar biogenesis protein FliO
MELLRQMMAVGLVFGLLGAALWWLRSKNMAGMPVFRGVRRGPRPMESIDRLALTAQHSLHLVRVGNRCLLISASPTGSTLVESLPSSEVEQVVHPGAGLPVDREGGGR